MSTTTPAIPKLDSGIERLKRHTRLAPCHPETYLHFENIAGIVTVRRASEVDGKDVYNTRCPECQTHYEVLA